MSLSPIFLCSTITSFHRLVNVIRRVPECVSGERSVSLNLRQELKRGPSLGLGSIGRSYPGESPLHGPCLSRYKSV